MASGPVVIPPMSEGIIVGKIRVRFSLAISQEVFVEPEGIGTPGAYVARFASRVYNGEELDGLSDPGERSERKSGTSGNESEEVNGNGVSRVGKGLSLQTSKSNAARYCVLKIIKIPADGMEELVKT